jgi:hypothetical protein
MNIVLIVTIQQMNPIANLSKAKVFKYEAVDVPWGRSTSSDGFSDGPSE